MNSYKLLIKNIGLLTLSNLATKLLSFFMVPLYTNILSTVEYGTYDLMDTTIGLLVPLLTIDIQEAVLRFSVDEDSDKKGILSTGLYYIFGSSVLITLITIFNSFTGAISVLKDYAIFFVLLYIVTALSGVLTYFARGINKISDISVAGVISSIVMITLNILFLVVLKIGLIGYFLASIIGVVSQIIYLLFRTKIRSYIKYISPRSPLSREMIKYSSPMVANAVAWWVNSASDRYIVTWICGIAENGIYSVSYKIPSIISILQNIFSQAWSLSAVKDFDRNDSKGFFANTYSMYNFLLVTVCSSMIVINKVLAKILFANEFYLAWKYAPFLMIGVVFSGMSGYIGGILSAEKKTGTFAITSSITAVINIMLNLILVWKYGAIGAAIATAIAYFVMWFLRIREMRKYVNIKLNLIRDYTSYVILVFQAYFMIVLKEENIFLWQELFLFVLILILYFQELTKIVKKMFALIQKR